MVYQYDRVLYLFVRQMAAAIMQLFVIPIPYIVPHAAVLMQSRQFRSQEVIEPHSKTP